MHFNSLNCAIFILNCTIHWFMCNPFTVHVVLVFTLTVYISIIYHLSTAYYYLLMTVFDSCCCNIANFPTVGLIKDYIILT